MNQVYSVPGQTPIVTVMVVQLVERCVSLWMLGYWRERRREPLKQSRE